jgi:hypothetical protein
MDADLAPALVGPLVAVDPRRRVGWRRLARDRLQCKRG